MNGDELRNMTFFTPVASVGYGRSEVDDLLDRMAAAIDAGPQST